MWGVEKDDSKKIYGPLLYELVLLGMFIVLFGFCGGCGANIWQWKRKPCRRKSFSVLFIQEQHGDREVLLASGWHVFPFKVIFAEMLLLIIYREP